MYRVSFGLLTTITLVVSTAAAATIVSVQSRATERDKIPNLTGAWTLNEDLSDDAAKVMESMHGGDQGRRGGGHRPPGGSGGHGPGMHGAGGRGEMSPEQMQAMRARMDRTLEAPARLTIVQADGSITFTDGDGRSQRFAINNKKEKRPIDNRMVEVRTKWDDGRLVNETWLDEGMKLTETYSLLSERQQLQVMVKIEGSHLPKPVNLRRVYDAQSQQ
jgi:hypothetical protein